MKIIDRILIWVYDKEKFKKEEKLKNPETGEIIEERTNRLLNLIVQILQGVVFVEIKLPVSECKSLANSLFDEVKTRLGKDFTVALGKDAQFAKFFRELHAMFKVFPRGEERDLLVRIYKTANGKDIEEYRDRRKMDWVH